MPLPKNGRLIQPEICPVLSLISIPIGCTSLVIPAALCRCLEHHPMTFQTALDTISYTTE